MLLKANRAINAIHQYLGQAMDIAGHYGDKMGEFGRMNSRAGDASTFLRKMAKGIMDPKTDLNAVDAMMSSLVDKASRANMSDQHFKKINTLVDKIRLEAYGTDRAAEVKRARKTYDKAREIETNRLGNKLGLL